MLIQELVEGSASEAGKKRLEGLLFCFRGCAANAFDFADFGTGNRMVVLVCQLQLRGQVGGGEAPCRLALSEPVVYMQGIIRGLPGA